MPQSEESEFTGPETYLSGPCTCSHEPEDHDWDKCEFDGCECLAHWEE